jgi:hypothetical protein
MRNYFNIYTRHDPTLSLREKTQTSSFRGETAVVCGAGGFIGGHLVKGLIANGSK